MPIPFKMGLFMDEDREPQVGWNDPPSKRGRPIARPSNSVIVMVFVYGIVVLLTWFYIYLYL